MSDCNSEIYAANYNYHKINLLSNSVFARNSSIIKLYNDVAIVLFAIICILFSLQLDTAAPLESKLIPVKLNVNEFLQYYPSYQHITTNSPVIPVGIKKMSSPDGTKDFVIVNLTSPKTPYEEVRSDIIVIQNGKKECLLTIGGFKNLYVDWITEEILKIDNWPGPGNSLRLTELIDVETGKVLFKSATRYDLPLPTNRSAN
jgi:hypothetical protein